MPTLMGSLCSRAEDWRPRTKGLLLAGWTRETVSEALGAM